MNVAALEEAYASGRSEPVAVVKQIFREIRTRGVRPVWIALVPEEVAIARAQALTQEMRATMPLWGMPFAVKDNIDVRGMETTAGCPAYAYVPEQSATAVERLEAAGAILIGKTNMDQFATGLVGTRTPYGACSSVFDARMISGGSSSGSAVAVASGLVTFALGTDTAGSGRVPAALNNLIGLKPTRGLVSAAGVVPACRSLDCVSVFAETAADAAAVLRVARGADARDALSRVARVGEGAAAWTGTGGFRFGVPRQAQREFFGDGENARLYDRAIAAAEASGGSAVEVDLQPFLDAAKLLYGGPWVAERYAAVGAFMANHAEAMDATVRAVISSGAGFTAAEYFTAAAELDRLRQQTAESWRAMDVLLLPTVPRSFTHEEIAQEPIARNSQLGLYTNFVNLLDLAAVALPAGLRADGLPFGVSLIGPAFSDEGLLRFADTLQRRLGTTLGGSARLLADAPPLAELKPPAGCLLLAVVGAHLQGQPLNWQLTQRDARLMRTCRTHPDYRFYALSGTVPAKPGLVWEPGFAGPGIEVEVWALPEETVGSFVDGVPQPLVIGHIRLDNGELVMGFLAEPAAIPSATEITATGGWRRYLSQRP